jgi:hypothetical protein
MPEELTPAERPDWIKCVGLGSHPESKPPASWCGQGFRPFFVDPTHAALNGRQQGRLVACPECVAAIYQALRNGSEQG